MFLPEHVHLSVRSFQQVPLSVCMINKMCDSLTKDIIPYGTGLEASQDLLKRLLLCVFEGWLVCEHTPIRSASLQ